MSKTNEDRDSGGKFTSGNSYAPKSGEVRNPKGRTKGVSIHQKLRDLLEGEGGDDLVHSIAQSGIEHAVSGNPKFWEMIVAIIDGKIPDRIAGHDGGPVTFDEEAIERIRRIVDSADAIEDDEDN